MNYPRHSLVAGIDFGTSYTKIYIEDQFTKRRKPVLFGKDRLGLVPSYVRLDKSEIRSPLEHADGIMIPYLKLYLVDDVSGRMDYSHLYQDIGIELPEAAILVTGYFLALIQSIHGFLAQDDDWRDFASERDCIVFQIAVPTGLREGDSKIDTQMLDCLKAAVKLSIDNCGCQMTVKVIEDALISLAGLSDVESSFLDESCHQYPEVASAVQTMLRAGDLPEGKYITMDVGAGTVDLNYFFRRGRATDRENASVDTWVAKVIPLGCAHLGQIYPGSGDHERGGKGMSDEEMRRLLSDEIKNVMRQVFTLQPRKVAGNGPDVFHHGVHAYIFGGGANISLYRDTFKATLDELDVRVAQIMRLPRPDIGFVAPNGIDDFGRLAVAYGISRNPANLAKTRLPREMQAILGNALKASRIDRIRGEIACSCFSNPQCFRCFGTGLIKDDDIAINLGAISLWNAKRNVTFSKINDKGYFSALPEVQMLSRYLDQLTSNLKKRRIVCSYIIFKRIEYIMSVIPATHCTDVLNDASFIISNVLDASLEEEVKTDFTTIVATDDGVDVEIEFVGLKQEVQRKKFRCLFDTLPSMNQDNIITKCYARIMPSDFGTRLSIRITEKEKPKPIDPKDVYYQIMNGKFGRGR